MCLIRFADDFVFVLAYLACFLTLNHHQCPNYNTLSSLLFGGGGFRVKLKWKNGAKDLAKAATAVD